EPAEELLAAAHFLNVPLDADRAATLVSGPIMQRYSKSPEHDYSPRLRADLIAETRRQRGEDIGAAMAWLESAAKDHPPIGEAMEQVQ
ncbi:MAG: hypothetical protein LC634_11705, partial [Sphingomonadales bacterium]|nr:hypothetical protein [Sphingomonadales bacterium]